MDQNRLAILQLVWLSCNFWTSEDKMKILSSRYLVVHVDVIRDTINCQKKSFHQFFNAHIFLHIVIKIVCLKIASVVTLMVSSKLKTTKPHLWYIRPSHYALCMFTFSMTLLWHFWLLILSYFQQKKLWN